MTRSSSPARRIIVAEAASATAGAEPRERSVSMVARLPCIARGCAVTTAMKLRCRPGRRPQAEDWLGRWAMNLMLINVSTRKLRRAVRLPEGDLPVIAGWHLKSAASRRFVALSAERLAEWMASDFVRSVNH